MLALLWFVFACLAVDDVPKLILDDDSSESSWQDMPVDTDASDSDLPVDISDQEIDGPIDLVNGHVHPPAQLLPQGGVLEVHAPTGQHPRYSRTLLAGSCHGLGLP